MPTPDGVCSGKDLINGAGMPGIEDSRADRIGFVGAIPGGPPGLGIVAGPCPVGNALCKLSSDAFSPYVPELGRFIGVCPTGSFSTSSIPAMVSLQVRVQRLVHPGLALGLLALRRSLREV